MRQCERSKCGGEFVDAQTLLANSALAGQLPLEMGPIMSQARLYPLWKKGTAETCRDVDPENKGNRDVRPVACGEADRRAWLRAVMRKHKVEFRRVFEDMSERGNRLNFAIQ